MKRNIAIFFIFSAFLFINGCSNALTGNLADNSDFYEGGVNYEAYFCPADNCSRIMTNFANNAGKSLHCAFYDINVVDLIKAIAAKSHYIDVKVVVDEGNYNGEIKGPGVKTANSRQYMHNKFCVADNNIVLTGSANPTNNGVNLENNNIIIINSGDLAQNYEDEFEELWGGVYSSGDNVKYGKIKTNIGAIENYFCPDDCRANSGGGIYRIINLASNANKFIKIASFSFTHEGLADELIKADIRGLNVSVLIEKKQRNVQNSQYERLRDFGVNVKVDGNKYNMHNKFVVIDGKIVITGSPNHSSSGNNVNDENMLIIYNENLALEFIKEFDKIFDKGEVTK